MTHHPPFLPDAHELSLLSQALALSWLGALSFEDSLVFPGDTPIHRLSVCAVLLMLFGRFLLATAMLVVCAVVADAAAAAFGLVGRRTGGTRAGDD